MFGLFTKKKKFAAEVAAEVTENIIEVAESIRNETDLLNRNLASNMDKRISSAETALENKLADVTDRIALAAESIKNEIDLLSRNLASNMDEGLSSAGAVIEDKLADMTDRIARIEEQTQQSLRYERRRQMALESILETLEARERREASPTLEALMSLAENLALTRLAASGNPEIDILYNKLAGLMDCFGLALISESGAQFDPAIHEACEARGEPSLPDGSVLEIVRPGFLLHGKVLRCATVVVNRHGGGEENESAPPEAGQEEFPC